MIIHSLVNLPLYPKQPPLNLLGSPGISFAKDKSSHNYDSLRDWPCGTLDKKHRDIRPRRLCRYREVIRVYCWLCTFIITCILMYWFVTFTFLYVLFVSPLFLIHGELFATNPWNNHSFFGTPTKIHKNITEVQLFTGKKIPGTKTLSRWFLKKIRPIFGDFLFISFLDLKNF